MSIQATTISVFLAFCFLTCSKKGSENTPGNTKDTSPPVIIIVSPMNNQTFSAGQNIQITANATDNLKVTELHIHVNNKTNGSLLRDIHSYPGEKSGTVQDVFAAQAGTIYTIKIIAYDPAQNLATAQIEVSANKGISTAALYSINLENYVQH